MSIEHFRKLEEVKQLETLIRSGNCIAESSGNGFHTFLYRLYSFYVVVMYCAQTDALLHIITLNQKVKKQGLATALPFYSQN